MKTKSIMWFRQDLRLSDNLALRQAALSDEVLPIYIFDDAAPAKFKMGDVSKIWLHHSLQDLNTSLEGKLHIYAGDTEEIFKSLLKKHKVTNVFWNICYEPWHVKQEKAVQALCDQNGVEHEAFNSNYLWRPQDVLKKDGTYYKVFTAYKRQAYSVPLRSVVKAPSQNNFIKDRSHKMGVDDLSLIAPGNAELFDRISSFWNIGESAAKSKLKTFISKKLIGYKVERDFPGKNHTSHLSPHLHFGEISPMQIWEAVMKFANEYGSSADVDHFLSEVTWREFACYLLYHFKKLHIDNFNSKFDSFPWKADKKLLKAWQEGKTGYPIVDAGMRELLLTGNMHNRVRMITASFLVKNLNIHWHEGRDWFWNYLVDADLASNSNNWQWVAGCGVDASPYFRIFNPVLQGEKFDKQGDYVRKFLPELKKLPDRYLLKPWTAPAIVLAGCGIQLGKDYPHPIVDLSTTRDAALKMYKKL